MPDYQAQWNPSLSTPAMLSGNLTSSPTRPETESALSGALNALVNQLAEHEHVLGTLALALQPVSLTAPSSGNAVEANKRPAASAVVDSILSSVDRLRSLTAGVLVMRGNLQV